MFLMIMVVRKPSLKGLDPRVSGAETLSLISGTTFLVQVFFFLLFLNKSVTF